MFAISIKVINEEMTFSKNHLTYHTDVQLNREDPTLKAFVDDAIEEFADDYDEVRLTITMVW